MCLVYLFVGKIITVSLLSTDTEDKECKKALIPFWLQICYIKAKSYYMLDFIND
ncbi:hypothetical protein Cpin_2559 [Chitinophaga pinensis DSM 2588]|uniref:Uncharacterized protein n=1 Tax=Chitinophaga pinensis (strain ATCC 43595 / DSM 2588 / LMG 13176 / NBRC 15968 / NCIMB 11800 / UQM 2034) TaxID=485918 RepID=A0A979G342_CHIPD|nr:hypothetical protein Cpin_2559 [Chitinophaga pinensis DSM 2588]